MGMKEKVRGWSRTIAFDGHILAELVCTYRGIVIFLFLLSVPQAAEGIVSVKFTEFLTNEVFRITDNSFQGFLAEVIIFLVLLLGIRISRWFFDRVYNKYDKKVSVHANEVLIEKISRIKYEYFENMETYQDIYMAGEAPGCYVEMLFLLRTLFIYGFMMIAYIVIMSHYHIYYAFAMLVVYLFLGIAVKIAAKGWDGFYEKSVVTWQRKELYFEGILSGRINHSNIQINRQLPFFAGKYEECADIERKNTLKFNLKCTMVQLLSGLIFTVVSLCILIAVMRDVVAGRMELGAVTAVCAILFSALEFMGRLVEVAQLNFKYMKTIQAYERVIALEEVRPEGGMLVSEEKNAELVIDKIWYAYQKKQYVIKGLSGCFSGREKIAVVGENGSGKTTLIQILLGLLERQEGSIRNSVGKAVAILQDFPEYALSVRENIELGRGGEPMEKEEVVEILKKVELWDAVSRLPDGIDTQIGQLTQGVEFSKGQFQRLAMGRLLADRKADVWILDEPTAYLDPVAEIEMYKNILDLGKEKMIFFISHRLGFARMADRIIVVEDGQIAEQGSHAELMQADGKYAVMYETQRSWYDE